MRLPTARAALLPVALTAVFHATPAEAQLGRLRDRVRARVEGEIARAAGGPATGAAEAAAPAQAAAAGGAGPLVVNFDFVPGERVLFAEDFSGDQVGDFPRRLELVEGNGEVAVVGGVRYLRSPGDLTFAIPLPETLPARFTVELDLLAPGFSQAYLYFGEAGEETYERGAAARALVSTHETAGTEGGLDTHDSRSTRTRAQGITTGAPFTVRIMGDGPYVKMYVGGTRVANAPGFDLGRGRRIVVHIPGASLGGHEGTYLTRIRVAAGGRDLYDALAADGRVAVHGILFDTGSDRIRPESAPTLRQIADLLRGHPELRLRVEGHTDAVGDDAANQALSQRRAAAVRDHLARELGASAARLEAQGLGESRPSASNDTAEGRQQNRRVELVRL